MKALKILLIIGVAALSWGCAKHKAPAVNAASDSGMTDDAPIVDIPSEPFVPEGSGPGEGPGSNWEYGGTAPLVVQSLGRMGDYTGRPMNNPQDIKVNLNLRKYGSNSYGGTVTVSYKEDGNRYEGSFTSGSSSDSNKYNIWFTKGGQKVYHGFFEDYMGGLVVVIDRTIDLGDGGSTDDRAGGSIWFKNFKLTYAPNPLYGYLPGFGRPQTYCWFISLGPYDCRAWKTDRGVETTRAVEPDNGYLKLGEFDGMSLKEAFNNELQDLSF